MNGILVQDEPLAAEAEGEASKLDCNVGGVQVMAVWGGGCNGFSIRGYFRDTNKILV